MGQVHGTFRHAEEMTGLVGCHRNLQPPGIRKAHVFAGEPDHPPGQCKGDPPRFQHPGQPVHRRIRIGIPHGFVEGGNQVVVFLPFCHTGEPFPGTLFDQLPGHMDAVRFPFPVEHHHFQGGQGGPGIAVGEPGQEGQVFLRQMDGFFPESPGIGEGPFQDPLMAFSSRAFSTKTLHRLRRAPFTSKEDFPWWRRSG